MSKNSQINKYSLLVLFWLLSLSLITPISARTFSPELLPLGAVVKIGERKLVKVTLTGKFVDSEKWNTLGDTTMQGWDACASLARPTGKNFTQGPILTDLRDGKFYEIRKFSDGKCWMVNNLRYGGDTDTCAGKTTFNCQGAAAPSHQFGAGTYGDCNDPRVGGVNPCTAGSTACGYYYNWQAAMQHSSAYYNSTYIGPEVGVQGLCPEGWRMPTGNISGDFNSLHVHAGSPATDFWQNGNWKGPYSGYCNSSGQPCGLGTVGYWWSSTVNYTNRIYIIYYTTNSSSPTASDFTSYGFSVRCLKD